MCLCYLGDPLDPSNAASKELNFLFRSGFVEGWVIFTVLVTVVIMLFCSSRVPSKKKITKKNKKMEVAIQGRKWPITKETSVDIKVPLFSSIYFLFFAPYLVRLY